MKKSLLTVVALFCAVIFAQAQTFESTETRELPSFTKIKSGSIIEVILKQGSKESVTVSTKGVPLTKVVTEVRAGELCLELEGNHHHNNLKVQVEVSYKQLSSIRLSGAGSLKSEGTLKAENLQIRLSGAGTINLASVEVLKLTTDISGAGNITLKGKADTHLVEVSGAGNYKAYDLITLNTKAKISGAGNVDIYVTGNLEGDVSGAGNLRYKGNPKNKDVQRSGAGSARAVD